MLTLAPLLCHAAQTGCSFFSASRCPDDDLFCLLQKFIREQRVDKVSDGTSRQLRCQTCDGELKVKFHWEFMWAMERLMSGTSLHTCFEFWALALTFGGFVFTFFTVLLKDKEIQENRWVFGVCIALLGIMTISTLHVVYKRWKVAQSDCVVVDSEV